MSDVFISYAREDQPHAERIARGLEAMGLTVFWDNEIPPGQTWADYIEAKLNQCAAAIVLWSEHSTKSQWVREEARMGRDKGVLIPVMIDASQPPFGFGEVQAANLASWNGAADHPHWRRFVDAVMSATKAEPRVQLAAPPAPPRTVAPPPEQPQSWSAPPASEKKASVPVWAWVVGAVVATVVVLGVIGSMMPSQPQQAVQTQPVNSTGEDPQQIIVAQLQQASAALAGQGYQIVGQPFSGALQPGQAWNIPAQMQVGFEYQILGVCDRDCSDLDLRVFDGNNAPIIEDTSTSSQPIVGVIPTSSGAFTVQVHMYNCTAAPCYYAVALYARPRQ